MSARPCIIAIAVNRKLGWRCFYLSNGDRFIDDANRTLAAGRLEMRQRGMLA